jgi:hypothetical protein
MQLVHKILVRPTSTDDASMVCGQLAPGSWLVEAGSTPPPAHDPFHLPAWRLLSGGTAVSLTSKTAIRLSLGTALIDWLAKTGLPVEPLAGLALHELILNAVVHGNLGVAFGHLDQWADLDTRQAMIARALGDASRAARLITIALGWAGDQVLAVIADQGDGYQAAHPAEPSLGSGRGLRIVRAVGAVQILQGGRQTALTLRSRVDVG